MVTIVNTPPTGESSDSGFGLLLGVVVAIVLVALFIFYGLPALRRNQAPSNPNSTNINVTLPSTDSNGGDTSSSPAQ